MRYYKSARWVPILLSGNVKRIFFPIKTGKIGHHCTSQYSFGVNKLPHLNKKSSILEKDAVQT